VKGRREAPALSTDPFQLLLSVFCFCADCGLYFKYLVCIYSTFGFFSYFSFFVFFFLMHSCLFKFTEFDFFVLYFNRQIIDSFTSVAFNPLKYCRGVFTFSSVRELDFHISCTLSRYGLFWSVKQNLSVDTQS
jgi:hypothetical protein